MSRRPSRPLPLLGLAAATVLAWASLPGDDPLPAVPARPSLGRYNLGESGLALQGHDPVAYFPEGGGQARRGEPGLEVTIDGVRYRFATPENRARFAADPARFEPAYGGWCAYAMADGDEVGIDPESFLVQDGRLLLFYRSFLADTRARWSRDPVDLARKADAHWLRIAGEGARDVSRLNLGPGRLALAGRDPVAYFPEGGGRPRAGRVDIEHVHQGVRYRFATETDRERFVADPARFEPAFGGWCALAMARGERRDVDPDAFLIEDGRLLLFERHDDSDARQAWQADAAALRVAAERSWEGAGD